MEFFLCRLFGVCDGHWRCWLLCGWFVHFVVLPSGGCGGFDFLLLLNHCNVWGIIRVGRRSCGDVERFTYLKSIVSILVILIMMAGIVNLRQNLPFFYQNHLTGQIWFWNRLLIFWFCKEDRNSNRYILPEETIATIRGIFFQIQADFSFIKMD